MATAETLNRPATLSDLIASGWKSKTIKEEVRGNFVRMLSSGEELFPGIVGYEHTVIPEVNLALLSGHDILLLGEKGQAKSRLMRNLIRFLDPHVPYLEIPGSPLREDPFNPITTAAKKFLADRDPNEVPIAWWAREDRYAERLAPGTKFADIIGEIDPAKLASGVSMSTEEALHFGLIPRMHRGIFAMNELPNSTSWYKLVSSISSKNEMCKSEDIRSASILTSSFCSLRIHRPTTAAAKSFLS